MLFILRGTNVLFGFVLVLLSLSSLVHALYVSSPRAELGALLPRDAVLQSFGNGTTIVVSKNGVAIAQGLASDGGGLVNGNKFSFPALGWIIFGFVVGLPLAGAGVRGYRLTSGVGLGLVLALPLYAAFVNTMGANGVGTSTTSSDIVLFATVIGVFGASFVAGALGFGVQAGVIAIAMVSGLSIGIRLVLLKTDLLIPIYAVNWVLAGVFMVINVGAIFISERMVTIFSTAATGTFLTALSVDLIINGQGGMSRGLRYLIDRNTAHMADLIGSGYHPPASTQGILGASIILILPLIYLQAKLFSGDFHPKETDTTLANDFSD